MSDIAANLRRTRADMLGTPDEEHYWHCHEAADEIDRLQKRNALLEDVAVAADKALWLANFGAQQCTQCAEIKGIIKPVLDKLREVGDE